MNTDDLKAKLRGQRALIRCALVREGNAKVALKTFDANTWNRIRGDGVKRTEADVNALVQIEPGRAGLEADLINAGAEAESLKVDTQAMLAEASIVCSEIAALSRISQ